MSLITVSYSGVHQAYQLALAAQELGELERFFCSFLNSPGKWGRALALLLGNEALKSREFANLDPRRVVEHPWPELAFKMRQRFFGASGNAWIRAAQRFDRWAARQLPKLESRVLVGSENCAYKSFQTAKQLGWKLIYDCPGYNAEQSNRVAHEAAGRLGLPFVSTADTSEITSRKAQEIGLADAVLCYSEFHARGVAARGVVENRIHTIPLWVDSDFWRSDGEPPSRADARQPLKAIFAGGINLRKGVPFLVEACRKLSSKVRLTLVGRLDPDVANYLRGVQGFATVLAPVSKFRLRELYQQHDILVLPSLGDSFGFVALEAMACGLPVIVTDNCGVPVPDASWRVPVMDSDAIALRLELYANDRDLVAKDGNRAVEFARQFTPSRYRDQIKNLYKQLLDQA